MLLVRTHRKANYVGNSWRARKEWLCLTHQRTNESWSRPRNRRPSDRYVVGKPTMWEIADELEMSDYVCSFNSLPWAATSPRAVNSTDIQMDLEQSLLWVYWPRATSSTSSFLVEWCWYVPMTTRSSQCWCLQLFGNNKASQSQVTC